MSEPSRWAPNQGANFGVKFAKQCSKARINDVTLLGSREDSGKLGGSYKYRSLLTLLA